ncbi:manganese-dependent inorganic pyrophosphatase [uncultured archaeon]|nr:manganese-dependent inorganic pyrophosphatase [uncultured archaeon]
MFKTFNFWKQRAFKRHMSQQDKRLTIYTRNNPDSDALASSLALKRIAEHYNIDAGIYYTGTIQNKTLINILGDDAINTPSISPSQNPIAFVDILPTEIGEKIVPAIVLGHTLGNTEGIRCSYRDIRTTETTSSILIEYLNKLGVAIDKQLATLLLFAIRDKTKTLITNITLPDLEAYWFIHKYVDMELLNSLEHPAVKLDTFEDLSRAIGNRVIKGASLFTTVGYVKDPGTIPKVCKYMLDIEGISTSLVFAVNATKIYIFAESKNMEMNMKNILKKAFGDWGEVIGGTSNASISIPLGVFSIAADNEKAKQLLLRSIGDSISSKYFHVLEAE